jgi:predicted O-methyltransferase YrrM
VRDPVREYILSMVSQDNPTLPQLGHRYEGRTDIQPAIGPEVGKLLGLLIRFSHATQVLELGTCLGYSTVWLAQAMETTHGMVTSVELDHELVLETERSVEQAGLTNRVRLMEGDAAKAVYELSGPFDLVLQDSDKPLYPALFDRLVQITRVGGILAADDALFRPMGIPAKFADPVHRYNQLATSDPRLYTTILPIGDGLTVSLKLAD